MKKLFILSLFSIVFSCISYSQISLYINTDLDLTECRIELFSNDCVEPLSDMMVFNTSNISIEIEAEKSYTLLLDGKYYVYISPQKSRGNYTLSANVEYDKMLGGYLIFEDHQYMAVKTKNKKIKTSKERFKFWSIHEKE